MDIELMTAKAMEKAHNDLEAVDVLLRYYHRFGGRKYVYNVIYGHLNNHPIEKALAMFDELEKLGIQRTVRLAKAIQILREAA